MKIDFSISSIVAKIAQPFFNLIDEVHTSTEEKIKAQTEMLKTLMEAQGLAMEYDRKLLEAQQEIIVAEAQGQSWLQRSWRPITMLTFLGLVVLDSLGLLANPLADEMWTLMQIGLGGYVIGRSAEKVVPGIVEAMKNVGK